MATNTYKSLLFLRLQAQQNGMNYENNAANRHQFVLVDNNDPLNDVRHYEEDIMEIGKYFLLL